MAYTPPPPGESKFRTLGKTQPEAPVRSNGQRAVLSTPGRNPAYVQRAIDAELEALHAQTLDSHNRNNQLNTSAFNLGQLVGGGELMRNEVELLLHEAGVAIGLTQSETIKTVHSGLSAGMSDPRTAPPPTTEVYPVTVLEDSEPYQDTEYQDTELERTTWWPQPIADRVAALVEAPAPTQLRRDDGQMLFYSGKVNGIIGESESGKSWIALLAATQAIMRVEHVLILDFEDNASSVYRRLKLLGVDDDKLHLVHYADPDEAYGLIQRSDLEQALGIRYAVIVVDGVNEAMTLCGYDLNSNTDATLFGRLLLRPLANTGAAVIAVDHVPKNPDTRKAGGIGAQAKRAIITGCQLAADVVEPFGVGLNGAIKLTVDKDKNGMVRGNSAAGKYVGKARVETSANSVRIRIAAPIVQLVDNSDTQTEWAPTVLMEKISRLLEGLTDPVSFNAITQATTGKEETIRKALDVLRSRGYIEITSGPRNSLLHRSVKPYRAVESSLSPTVSRPSPGDGEESVSTVSPEPPPYGGRETGDSHGPEDAVPAPTASQATLDIPDGYSHCNSCGELTAEVEIETNDGICDNCQRRS